MGNAAPLAFFAGVLGLTACGGAHSSPSNPGAADAATDGASPPADSEAPTDAPSPDAPACAPDPLASWSVFPSPPDDALESVFGSGPLDVWASGTSLWHWDGSKLGSVAMPPGVTSVPASAVWTGAPGDLWFAYAEIKQGPAHLVGQTWSTYPALDNRQVFHLWGNSLHDVWGTELGTPGTPGYSGHWDGTTWAHVDSSAGGALWGSSPKYVWAFGIAAFHWNGGATWAPGPSLTTPKNAVWGSGADDVWATGTGNAMHFDGTSWTGDLPLPTTATVRGVWGPCRSDLWAVGDGGVLLHYDGATWTSVASPTTKNLRAIWGSSPDDAWAVGDTVLRLSR